MSEEKSLKEQIGNLGLYLIGKAKKEIKKNSQQLFFEKAKIKKILAEQINEKSLKIKNRFTESYINFLNDALSSNLLRAKQYSLDLKNRLLKEFRSDFFDNIKKSINKNYSNYINYLLESIKKNSTLITKQSDIVIILNFKDYDYFKQNANKIKNLLKNEVVINKSKEDFIGGFKILQTNGNITFDYTINNLINKNSSLIQSEFLKVISDSEIKDIGRKFEEFIQKQKVSIERELKDYDKI